MTPTDRAEVGDIEIERRINWLESSWFREWSRVDHLEMANMLRAQAAALTAARAEIDTMRTWPGLMATVDEFYPADTFPTLTDDPARDAGPRIVALLRHLDAARAEVDEARREGAAYRRYIVDRDFRDEVDEAILRSGSNGDDVNEHTILEMIRGIASPYRPAAPPQRDPAGDGEGKHDVD